MSNSSKPIKFAHHLRLANQSNLNGAHVIEITKACIVAFMKARNFSAVQCREKRMNWKKKQKMVKIHFRSTSKLISRVKEQQNCLWTTFYQMDFMKR